MADSFLDTAGGLQQVPTINTIDSATAFYAATDGSMQSALPINVGDGGEVIEPGTQITVKSSNDALPTYTGTFEGGTPPTVELPSTVALVPNAGTVSVENSTGSITADATVVVTNGAITAATLSSVYTIAAGGDQIAVIDEGGSNVSGPITVSDGVLNQALLPPDHCIVANAQQVTMTVDGVQKIVTFTVASGVITAETTADPA